METAQTLLAARSVLADTERVTGQGAVYVTLKARPPLTGGAVCSFCRLCLSHAKTASFCRFTYSNAAMHSLSSGEPFYSQCWAGLLFATVGVAPANTCIGGIAAGGFYAGGEEAEIRETVAQRLQMLPRRDAGAFLERLPSVRRITPSALRGLGMFLMEATFSSGLNAAAFFAAQNARYRQQREIAEALAELRGQEAAGPDVAGDTYQLAAFLDRRDPATAQRFVSQYLARLLMASHWRLPRLKAHLRVLLAVMTSREILGGLAWDAATNRELQRMSRLEKARSTEESCYEAAEMIREHFARRDAAEQEEGTLGERAALWMQRHYAGPVALETAARGLGVSTSTLAHGLKRETGRTFRQLLMDTRIAEARRLLATTDLALNEVAERCGFSDQSHFTRSLKAAINLTPGEFRKLLRLPREEILR